MLNQFIVENMKLIESIAKKAVGNKWREGISLYYLHLYEKGEIPKNKESHIWYFMKNISKPSGALNYTKKVNRLYEYDLPEVEVDEEEINDLKIDLGDEKLIDFLMNNPNNDKWLKIYNIIYKKKIKLDIFEETMLEHLLNGLTIREISEKTGNSVSWCYLYRKKIIKKLKDAL